MSNQEHGLQQLTVDLDDREGLLEVTFYYEPEEEGNFSGPADNWQESFDALIEIQGVIDVCDGAEIELNSDEEEEVLDIIKRYIKKG